MSTKIVTKWFIFKYINPGGVIYVFFFFNSSPNLIHKTKSIFV